MKVGTDGVLLGAWTNVQHAKTILDVGTGSGLIALMLAQRTSDSVHIDAVEIEQHAYEQACQNIKNAPWHHRVNAHYVPLQQFESTQPYDLIVSNPPYFQNSQKPPDEKRVQARHTTSLSYPDLLNRTVALLGKSGRLNVILPFTEGLQFIALAEQHNLHCSRQWSFRTRHEKPIERWLLEFSSDSHLPLDTGEILLYKHGEEWSDGYKQLTKEFYLKL
jgi:tRNA1Val (adenine37-N6)-methyltransferase